MDDFLLDTPISGDNTLTLTEAPVSPTLLPVADASEHAFMAGYVADNDIFGPSYVDAERDLLVNNNSAIVDRVNEEYVASERKATEDELITMVTNGETTLDEARQIFPVIDQFISNNEVLRTTFAERVGENALQLPDKQEVAVQQQKMDELLFELVADRMVEESVARAMAQVASEQGASSPELLVDLVDGLVPGAYEIAHQDLFQHVFGKGRWRDFLFPGEARADIRERFASLNAKDKMLLAEDLINYIKNNSVTAAEAVGADKNQLNMLDMLSNTLREPPEGIDWDRWINNVIGPLDWVTVGGALRGARNLVRGTGTAGSIKANAPIKFLNYLNPTQAKLALERGIANPSTLRAIGVTFDDVLQQWVFPKPVFGHRTTGPSALVDNLIRRTLGRGELFTPAEKTASVVRAQEELKSLNGPYYYEHLSTVSLTDEGYAINAVVGAKPNTGWLTADEAIDDFLTRIGYLADDPLDARVLQRTPGDPEGTLVDIGSVRELGEFPTPKMQAEQVKFNRRLLNSALKRLKASGPLPEKLASDVADLDFMLQKLAELGRKPLPVAHRAIVHKIVDINQGIADLAAEGRAVRPLPYKTVVLKSGKRMVSPHGEFFIQYRQSHLFDESDKLIYGSDPVITAGNAGRWRADPDTQFNSAEVLTAAKRTFQLTTKTEQELHDLVAPFNALPNSSRQKVERALEKGAIDGVEYSLDDLTNLFKMTDAEKMGYLSVRFFWQTVADLEDAHVGRWLHNNHYRLMTRGGDTPFVAYTRPVPEEELGRVKTVYDPASGQVYSITPSQARLLNIEESVVKHGDGVNLTHYVLRDGDTTVGKLPTRVLHHPKGWINRVYKDVYEVQRVETVRVNGEETKIATTVARAPTRGRGENLIRGLKATSPDVEYIVTTFPDVRLERPSREGFLMDNLFEQYASEGRFAPDVRGPNPIQGIDGRPAKMVSPVEALNRTASAVAHLTGTRMFNETQRTAFVNWYRDKVSLPKNRAGEPVFPSSASDIRPLAGQENSGHLAKAKDLWNYLKFMEGVETGPAMQWRAFWVRMAEKIEGAGDSYMRYLAAKPALAIKDYNPLSILQTAAFTTMIAANPLRQLALQASQVSFLAATNAKYFHGEFGKEILAMSLGLATATRPAAYADARLAGSKLLKITPEEFDVLINTFRESGLLSIIDSHSALAGSLFNQRPVVRNWTGAPIQAVGDVARNAITLPGRALKRLGFDPGEAINLTASWLFARREFIEKNPNLASLWASPINSRKIAARAEELALSMNKTGQFAYQNNWMSIILQFLAIQQKTFLALLPSKIWGNSKFTPDMKARLALGQVLLWGPAGAFGLGQFWQAMKEKVGLQDDFNETPAAKVVDHYVTGGLMDLLVNGTFAALGEETDLDVASSFAPASGLIQATPSKFLNALLSGEDIPWETFLGPSAGFLGKTQRAIEYAAMLRKMDMLSGPEKFYQALTSVRGFGSIASGWSNLAKARWAARTGMAVDSWGNETVTKTYVEALAQAGFGVNTYAEETYYRAKKTLQEQGKEVEQLAAEYYGILHTLTEEWFKKEHNEGNYNLYLEAVKNSTIFLAGLEDHEKGHFWASFDKAYRKGVNNGQEDLMIMVSKMIDAGSIGKIADMEQKTLGLCAGGAISQEHCDKLMLALSMIKDREANDGESN